MLQQFPKLGILIFFKNSDNSLIRFIAMSTYTRLFCNNLLTKFTASPPFQPSGQMANIYTDAVGMK